MHVKILYFETLNLFYEVLAISIYNSMCVWDPFSSELILEPFLY